MPLWQVDCENFRRTGKPFELRNVTTDEHRDFLEQFAARYELAFELNDTTARFGEKKRHAEPLLARSFSV